MTTSVPVQYAIPRRQVITVLGGVFLLVGTIVALGLTLQSPKLASGLALGGIALFIWWLVRNVNGDGDASLDDHGLEIVPRRKCFCAGRGPVRIAWGDLEKVEAGATNAPNNPRIYVVLRTREPRRSWIVTPRNAEDVDFHLTVIERANAARTQSGAERLAVRSPFEAVGWRIAVFVILAAFAVGIIATIAGGEASNPYMWGKLLILGGFGFSLAKQVFSKPPRP